MWVGAPQILKPSNQMSLCAFRRYRSHLLFTLPRATYSKYKRTEGGARDIERRSFSHDLSNMRNRASTGVST